MDFFKVDLNFLHFWHELLVLHPRHVQQGLAGDGAGFVLVLVREVNQESRRKGTFFDFALVYPSQTSRGSYQRAHNQFMDYQSRDIGTTVSGRKGVDDSKVSYYTT